MADYEVLSECNLVIVVSPLYQRVVSGTWVYKVCSMQGFGISVLSLQLVESSWRVGRVGLLAYQSKCNICLEASGIDTAKAALQLVLLRLPLTNFCDCCCCSSYCDDDDERRRLLLVLPRL